MKYALVRLVAILAGLQVLAIYFKPLEGLNEWLKTGHPLVFILLSVYLLIIFVVWDRDRHAKKSQYDERRKSKNEGDSDV